MQKIKLFQVDAFTDQLFGGNPAAICIVDDWLETDLMQKIAAENNLAETAFIVSQEEKFGIRWFTPTVEVDLCGHATLASAYVVFNHLDFVGEEVIFDSPRSGILKVKRQGEVLSLDFPTDELRQILPVSEIEMGIGMKPQEFWKGKTDFLVVVNTEAEVARIQPHFPMVAKIPGRGLIVTAPGNDVDFVSRFFAPQSGIEEDPVTGSAHTSLIPYWAKRLKKKEMTARQISPRGGFLQCVDAGERVKIGGKAVLYLIGEIVLQQ